MGKSDLFFVCIVEGKDLGALNMKLSNVYDRWILFPPFFVYNTLEFVSMRTHQSIRSLSEKKSAGIAASSVQGDAATKAATLFKQNGYAGGQMLALSLCWKCMAPADAIKAAQQSAKAFGHFWFGWIWSGFERKRNTQC